MDPVCRSKLCCIHLHALHARGTAITKSPIEAMTALSLQLSFHDDTRIPAEQLNRQERRCNRKKLVESFVMLQTDVRRPDLVSVAVSAGTAGIVLSPLLSPFELVKVQATCRSHDIHVSPLLQVRRTIACEAQHNGSMLA